MATYLFEFGPEAFDVEGRMVDCCVGVPVGYEVVVEAAVVLTLIKSSRK